MDPNLVKSPKNKIKEVYHVFPIKEEGFSFAVLKYGTQLRIGIRWDGEENELGYPHSYGYPTWFIIPKSVAISYAQKIGKTEMFDMFLKTSDKTF